MHFKSKKYVFCKHTPNNIEINRTADGSGGGVDPPSSKWDIHGTGSGHRVDPQKVEHKYGSRDGVDSPENSLHFGTHMVIKTLDQSTCKNV